MYITTFLFLLMVGYFFFLYETKIHILRAMLILEAMMLTALIISIFMLSSMANAPFLFLLLLTFAVCEAGLGLSILLTYIKLMGSDMISSSSVL
uniref:NADH-ubiquinone oxidoreductase chain 4L n=1 Tax=Stereophaedusa okimodoki TaxID=1885767 RepID=A0A224A0E7_9EUPU|nr:NADH dehydrogenase subunit 4L [Stereophaedusa okimodoki]BBA10115.1 NADH dehydrogenase subunit 4L [Stereophaedusa okimodoki]